MDYQAGWPHWVSSSEAQHLLVHSAPCSPLIHGINELFSVYYLKHFNTAAAHKYMYHTVAIINLNLLHFWF